MKNTIAMNLLKTIPWIDPLKLAQGISENEKLWVLLYSSMNSPFSGRYSILAMLPEKELKRVKLEHIQKYGAKFRKAK